MPYTRIWVSDLDAELLLELAKVQEIHRARSLDLKPGRVTLRSAVKSCFIEGLEDLQARASDFRDPEDD